MKKFLVGGLAVVALAVPATASAQSSPTPIVTVDGKISKSNAGTKAKPTPVKFTFKAVNSAESQTTVSKITLDLPSGVRFDGSKLVTCTFGTLSTRGPSGCKSGSRLGTGVAYAFIVNKTAPAPDCVGTRGAARGCLTFRNTFFVGGRRLMSIFLQQIDGNGNPVSGGVQKTLQGKINTTGRRMDIEIPRDLQSPAPNIYSALLQLSGSFERTRRVSGRNYSFVATTGCSNRTWASRTTFTYVPTPTPPPVTTLAGEKRQSCTK